MFQILEAAACWHFLEVHRTPKICRIIVLHLLMHILLSDATWCVSIIILFINCQSIFHLLKLNGRWVPSFSVYIYVRVWKYDTSFFLYMFDFTLHNRYTCYISHLQFMHMRFIFFLRYRLWNDTSVCFEKDKWNMKL